MGFVSATCYLHLPCSLFVELQLTIVGDLRYYRWPAEREDPLIYVTKTSLLLYLLEIDAAVPEDISVRLSWCMRGRSIVVDFPDKAPYRPVALGRCTSREEYLDCISRAVKEESSTPSPQDGLVMDDLRLNHDAIIGPQKVLGTEKDMELDRKSLRRDKNVERTARKLKRAERYLGLRQKRVKGANTPPCAGWAPVVPR